MNSQELRNIQEAYLKVVENQQLDEAKEDSDMSPVVKRQVRNNRIRSDETTTEPELQTSRRVMHTAMRGQKKPEAKSRPTGSGKYGAMNRRGMSTSDKFRKEVLKRGLKEELDLYDIILSHLLDEGYAETPEAAEAIMVNMSEDWRDDIMEKEDSEYEKASDAALDSRYGYGRASGDKRSFGRAANRSSAAAALRAIRRGERSGSGTSREAGADAVHQGWARTARTSADQTPEKKERRAKLANTSYSNLPDDEKEKDRVSFDAVRATYNRNKK